MKLLSLNISKCFTINSNNLIVIVVAIIVKEERSLGNISYNLVAVDYHGRFVSIYLKQRII